jgi:hypothetical protein
LDEAQKREFDALLITEKYTGVPAMNKTTFEKGIEKGIERGIEQGRRETVREDLEERFGPLSPKAEERLQRCLYRNSRSCARLFAMLSR